MITVTPEAAAQLRQAQVQKRAEGFGLRVQVVGGGCEGFLYDLLFEDAPEDRDHVFESNGQRVFVSPRVLPVINGLIIDHAKTPYGTGFVFTNPSAGSRCGCGASFH